MLIRRYTCGSELIPAFNLLFDVHTDVKLPGPKSPRPPWNISYVTHVLTKFINHGVTRTPSLVGMTNDNLLLSQ